MISADRIKYVLLPFFVALLLLCGGQACLAFSPPADGKMDVAMAESYLRTTPDVFILDVRTPEEFGEKHVSDAVNIPVDELKNRLAELPEDRPILIYCRSGKRALNAFKQLTDEKTREQRFVGRPGIFYVTGALAK